MPTIRKIIQENAPVFTILAIIAVAFFLYEIQVIRTSSEKFTPKVVAVWNGLVTTDLNTYEVKITEKQMGSSESMVRFVELSPLGKDGTPDPKIVITGQDFGCDNQFEILFNCHYFSNHNASTGKSCVQWEHEKWQWYPDQSNSGIIIPPFSDKEISTTITELTQAFATVYNRAHMEEPK